MNCILIIVTTGFDSHVAAIRVSHIYFQKQYWFDAGGICPNLAPLLSKIINSWQEHKGRVS